VLHAEGSGFGSLILLGNGRRERHCFFSVAELRDEPSSLNDSREALQDVVDNRWNVYTSLATFATTPAKGRGTRADVLEVPGVWADVDVKPDVEGYLCNESDVVAYVEKLPRPTLEVASGSGGRHLYWLTHTRLEAHDGQKLLLAWLDFLRDVANGATVENVHDTTRILRLAGTVRWPKEADTVAPMPHRVELLREGPRYHADELRMLAQPAHDAARKMREEARAQRSRELTQRNKSLTPSGMKYAAYYAGKFNKDQDWDTLLIRDGWTLHSDATSTVARCRFWTRPGKSIADGKSASTDFIDASGVTSQVMSIYTKDAALVNLWENADTHDGVGTCSKWRFALVRLYEGNEKQLIQDVMRHHGRLS
jgi:hypothetical protein